METFHPFETGRVLGCFKGILACQNSRDVRIKSQLMIKKMDFPTSYKYPAVLQLFAIIFVPRWNTGLFCLFAEPTTLPLSDAVAS
uniref:Uncharacterized protein n=1 Tax=Oryza nivara TaxID=4536 RepID=A0A0E0G622_ORYNI